MLGEEKKVAFDIYQPGDGTEQDDLHVFMYHRRGIGQLGQLK